MKTTIFSRYWMLSLLALTFVLSGCEDKHKTPKNTGKLAITSEPAGAEITINGTKNGTTPKTWAAVAADNYIVKLQKNGFATSWQMVKIAAGKDNKINVVLQPMTSSILIESKPEHAQIVIDGQLKGETPLVLPNLKFGEYAAKIEKTGYASKEIKWKVENERPRKIMIDLLSNIGEVNITSEPVSAQISIDGRPRGVTPFSGTLEEGKHKINLSKPGYTPLEDFVEITRNEKHNRNFELKLLPGGITVATIPAGAAININNRPYGNSPVTAEGLIPGKYTVAAAMNGFDSESQTVIVDPGRTTGVSFTMTRNTGGLDLVINPPGTTVYLNGKRRGITEEDTDKANQSKVFRISNLAAGTYTVKIAHKRGRPAEKVFDVKVTKGKITRPAPMNMWVANTEIKLTGGRIFQGVLIYETKTKIMFSPEPGISHELNRTELEYMKPLEEEDE